MKAFFRAAIIGTGLFIFGGLNAMSYAQEMNHELFSGVLGDHVEKGLVDYPGLCGDKRLEAYLGQLEGTDPSALSRDEAMAFWINAYNAFTLELICGNYPLKSINELHTGGLILGSILKKTAWDRGFIEINGRDYSLGQIEHKILRPRFDDPRIHFAIVCAARSCPPLRSEAYEAGALDRQLDDQGRLFLAERSDLNDYDLDKKIAYLSPIFSWFKKDFGEDRTDRLLFLADYMPPEAARSVRAAPEEWTIRYKTYDWSLNEQ